MRNVVIIGSGAHAAEIESYILDNNRLNCEINIIGFVSENNELHQKYSLISPFLGSEFNSKFKRRDIEIILGFSNIKGRTLAIEKYKREGYKFATFIHHTSYIFHSAKIGEGCIICPYCQIGPNVSIGNFNTLNNKVNVGHDTILGENNVISPNVGFSGNTKIENNNFFSINSATIPNVKIGSNNVIAPNMVVEKNIDSDSTYFHRYKETVLAIPKL